MAWIKMCAKQSQISAGKGGKEKVKRIRCIGGQRKVKELLKLDGIEGNDGEKACKLKWSGDAEAVRE